MRILSAVLAKVHIHILQLNSKFHEIPKTNEYIFFLIPRHVNKVLANRFLLSGLVSEKKNNKEYRIYSLFAVAAHLSFCVS